MFKLIIFFTLNLHILIGDVKADESLSRNKRYLVYPNAGPSRVQFIFGLGIPVDLKEQALTIGSVIKMQYLVPVNSSEYTSKIYGFANTVSRDMNVDVSNTDPDDVQSSNENKSFNENVEATTYQSDFENTTTIAKEDDNDTLVDIYFSEKQKRSLIYTEGGISDNTLKSDEELPLDEAIRRQEIIDQKSKEELEPQRLNRWDFYKILERTAERYGYTGRPCLLRTICEAAEVPFTYKNGLFGEIGHILFTPSTTTDELTHHTDNEYHAAEKLGKTSRVDCENLFPECEGSVLETFTKIGLNMMHKFGFQ